MHIPIRTVAIAPWTLLVLLVAGPTLRGSGEDAPSRNRSFRETLAGTTVAFEMVRIPGGRLEVVDPRAEGGRRVIEVKPFWIGRTEVTWDEYDVFVFGLDGPAGIEVDAESRPTKPYISADRGFGHNGYAAMSVALKGARAYCDWLRRKTGRPYRLPTEDEWEFACLAGSAGPWSCGEDPSGLPRIAWFAENSDGKTHPVGSLEANGFSLFDMHGNVCEWVAGRDGRYVVKGGSYLDPAPLLAAWERRPPSRAWNASDPQIPKSVWWLCDAGFVGFRVAMDDVPDTDLPPAAREPNQEDA